MITKKHLSSILALFLLSNILAFNSFAQTIDQWQKNCSNACKNCNYPDGVHATYCGSINCSSSEFAAIGLCPSSCSAVSKGSACSDPVYALQPGGTNTDCCCPTIQIPLSQMPPPPDPLLSCSGNQDLAPATTLPSGQITGDILAGYCQCSLAGPCGSHQIPSCNGSCPIGEKCTYDGSLSSCICVTSTPMPTLQQCGNGIVEQGEQCDDGNIQSGDGCSANCSTEVTSTSFSTPTPFQNSICNLVGNNQIDIISQVNNEQPKSIINDSSVVTITTTQPSGICPFNSSLLSYAINPNPGSLIKTVEVIDKNPNCEPCQQKQLLTQYFNGDTSVANQLCSLPMHYYQNCLVLSFTDIIDHLDASVDSQYLAPSERENLALKWPAWDSINHESKGATVYASSRQTESSRLTPLKKTLDIIEILPDSTTKNTNHNIGEEIKKRNIKPEPKKVISDLDKETNIWPDYNNEDNRREAGTLPYKFWLKEGENILRTYQPFYHATFHGLFTLGISHYSVKNSSVENGFSALLPKWRAFTKRVLNQDLSKSNEGDQVPVKSPWIPIIDLVKNKPADTERFAIIIKGAQYTTFNSPTNLFSSGPTDQGYTFENNVNLMKYIFGILGISDDNIIVTSDEWDSLDKAFKDTEAKAKSAKANGKKTQRVVYLIGHGYKSRIEQGLSSSDADSKQGAGEWKVRSWLTDFLLKQLLRNTGQYHDFPNNNKNKIDHTYIILDSCHSGGAVI